MHSQLVVRRQIQIRSFVLLSRCGIIDSILPSLPSLYHIAFFLSTARVLSIVLVLVLRLLERYSGIVEI
jgi:hypothetical protein